MSDLKLVHVHPSTSVDETIKRFRRGTQGIVVSGRDVALVLSGSQILHRRNLIVEAGMDPSVVPVETMLPGSGGPGSIELSTRPGRGSDLRDDSEDVGAAEVRSVDGDEASVTGPPDVLAILSVGLVVCSCAGAPVHTFTPRQIRVVGRCNMPHGVAVRCLQV